MKKAMLASAIFSLFMLIDIANAYADISLPVVVGKFITLPFESRGWLCSIIVVILIIAIETFFVRKLLSLSFLSGFRFTFIINFVSSLFGFIITSIPIYYTKHPPPYHDNMELFIMGMVPGYLITVLLEGLILIACSSGLQLRNRTFDCFKTSALMNFFSYLILLASVIIFDLLIQMHNNSL